MGIEISTHAKERLKERYNIDFDRLKPQAQREFLNLLSFRPKGKVEVLRSFKEKGRFVEAILIDIRGTKILLLLSNKKYILTFTPKEKVNEEAEQFRWLALVDNGEAVKVNGSCWSCEKPWMVCCYKEDWDSYKKGEPIEFALCYVKPIYREMILTNCCIGCVVKKRDKQSNTSSTKPKRRRDVMIIYPPIPKYDPNLKLS